MTRLLLTAFLLLTGVGSFAQSTFTESKDPENGSMVYKGAVTFSDLDNREIFPWFPAGAAAYKPDTASIRYLKSHLPGHELVLFLGTWCEDSQYLVPKLYTVLRQAGYPLSSVKVFGVDRAKKTINGEETIFHIERVPTLIVMKDHIVVGRITEQVRKSAEADLSRIIEQEKK